MNIIMTDIQAFQLQQVRLRPRASSFNGRSDVGKSPFHPHLGETASAAAHLPQLHSLKVIKSHLQLARLIVWDLSFLTHP
ncbi:hypothetical protein L1887_09134 [Cichorium endivia]|nr:hypothetical protein L1887_09134 [Cichorium endivia]